MDDVDEAKKSSRENVDETEILVVTTKEAETI